MAHLIIGRLYVNTLRKDQEGKVIEQIKGNSIKWLPRQTVHQKLRKKEINQAMKGHPQAALKSMILKAANITSNRN